MKPDDIEQRVCDRLRSLYGEAAAPLIADIEQRQAFGLKKYGLRLKDNHSPLHIRLRHMLEELLDAAVYAEWIAKWYTENEYARILFREKQDQLMRMALELKLRIPDEPPTSKPADEKEEVWP